MTDPTPAPGPQHLARSVLVALGLLGACDPAPDTPDCTVEACAEVCAERADAAIERGLADPTTHRLTALEWAVLSEDVRAVRRGVRPVGERGFGVCVGTTSCDAFVGEHPPGKLDPGRYFVRGTFDVPELGVWGVTARTRCWFGVTEPAAEGTPPDLEETEVFRVRRPVDGGSVTLSPLTRFESPSPDGRQRYCRVELVMPDGSVPEGLFASYTLPGDRYGD